VVSTYVDYLWFEERFPHLAEAYCVTLVGDETSPGLLDRFGVVGDRVDRVGVGELVDRSYAVWDAHQGDVQLVAATSVGQWALAVEVNGCLGVTEELFGRLSAGSRLVSHFRNVNAADRFSLVDDGRLVVDFEPLFAWHRSGSDPDVYAELMRTVGMRMGQDDDLGEPDAAAFALAEAITGVRLTAELFERSTFACGLARPPRRVCR
jgi:hypothetical protein